MRYLFLVLITWIVGNIQDCHAQDSILVRGYYIVKYNKSEMESKEKNAILKKEGKVYFEPIDYERVYYFIPIEEFSGSLLSSINGYKYEFRETNYFLPQSTYSSQRKHMREILGKNIDLNKETIYFDNNVLYSVGKTSDLYSIYYIEGNAVKYHSMNKKESRLRFGLSADEVSKGDFFDVVLIYHYKMVTNNFIHLDGFKKWEYKP